MLDQLQAPETEAMLYACLMLTDPDSDQPVADLTVKTVETALPEVAAAAFVGDERCMQHTLRFDGPVAIVPIESADYCFGRIEVFTTRRELTPRDYEVLRVISRLSANAVTSRGLMRAAREGVDLADEINFLKRSFQDERQQLRDAARIREQQLEKLAFEIRENALQSLAAIMLGIQRIECKADSKTVASEIKGSLVETINVLRQIAKELTPPTLGQLGLAAALEALPEVTSGPSKGEVPSLKPEVEAACLSVIRELLSDAGQSSVDFEVLPGHLRLTVKTPDLPKLDPQKWVRLRNQASAIGSSLRVRVGQIDPATFTLQVPLATSQG